MRGYITTLLLFIAVFSSAQNTPTCSKEKKVGFIEVEVNGVSLFVNETILKDSILMRNLGYYTNIELLNFGSDKTFKFHYSDGLGSTFDINVISGVESKDRINVSKYTYNSSNNSLDSVKASQDISNNDWSSLIDLFNNVELYNSINCENPDEVLLSCSNRDKWVYVYNNGNEIYFYAADRTSRSDSKFKKLGKYIEKLSGQKVIL